MSTPRARVLIVCDDPSSRAALERHVAALGCAALLHDTGDAALAAAERGRPSVVVVDGFLRDGDPIRLTRALRIKVGPGVPIILITGLGDTDGKRRGLAAGADDFLARPLAAVDVEIRLSAALRLGELSAEVRATRAALDQSATIDRATGLPGRAALADRLDQEFARARRYRHDLAVVVAELDEPTIRRAGSTSAAMIQVAAGLQPLLRRTDQLGRWQEARLLALVIESDALAARALVLRWRDALAAASLTLSAGIADSSHALASTADALVGLAERALAEGGGRSGHLGVAEP